MSEYRIEIAWYEMPPDPLPDDCREDYEDELTAYVLDVQGQEARHFTDLAKAMKFATEIQKKDYFGIVEIKLHEPVDAEKYGGFVQWEVVESVHFEGGNPYNVISDEMYEKFKN